MRKKVNRARRRQQTSEARREADKKDILEEEERLVQKQAAKQRQRDPEGVSRTVRSPPREGDRARRKRHAAEEYRNGQSNDYMTIQPIIQAAYDRGQTAAKEKNVLLHWAKVKYFLGTFRTLELAHSRQFRGV